MNLPYFFHVYVSSAVQPFTNNEILLLLAKCRSNNEKQGITGILLYKDGNFMQVLEGPESVVRELLAKIHTDPRHHGLINMIEGTSDERQFADWTMGFRDLSSDDVKALQGYNEFLNLPLNALEFRNNPSRCQRLLLFFKQNCR